MSPEVIRTTVEPIYRQLFGAAGFEELNVRAGRDHADEPALFISARIKGAVDEALQKKVTDLKARIFELFRREGEERFPYIWITYDDPSVMPQTATRTRRHS